MQKTVKKATAVRTLPMMTNLDPSLLSSGMEAFLKKLRWNEKENEREHGGTLLHLYGIFLYYVDQELGGILGIFRGQVVDFFLKTRMFGHVFYLIPIGLVSIQVCDHEEQLWLDFLR
jgi:hypothetical protein